MITIVNSMGLKGLEGYKIKVEVLAIPGKDGFRIVGLPDKTAKESKHRVSSALFENHCSLSFQNIPVV